MRDLGRLARFQGDYFDRRSVELRAQLGRGATQDGKCAEVSRDYFGRSDQSSRVGCLLRAHRKVVADWHHGSIWRVQLAIDPHVAEDTGIPRVVDAWTIVEAQDIADGLAKIDRH